MTMAIYRPTLNRAQQTVTFPSGTVYCDAFRNLAHGTYYRTSLKPHEQTEVDRQVVGRSKASVRRRGKIMRRVHLLDPMMPNR